jgi:hypothetical protein
MPERQEDYRRVPVSVAPSLASGIAELVNLPLGQVFATS